MKPRVRIAPSPTGFLHVGTARTALYNWLFARGEGGKFILRIEDTDVNRSTSTMTDAILESLKWLGLEWDEGPYFQSDRFSIYKKYANLLLKNGACYFCYCTHEELEDRKKKVVAQKGAWKYDRRCLDLSDTQKAEFKKRPKAIRFCVPEMEVNFEDGLHGVLKRSSNDIEDFVILKSDGSPSYNFACVVDDHEFNITHVIRGEDHISNTFKQILLYKAFGWSPPKFIHLPLILGHDRSKLSKRHGAVSVLDYRKDGILPEAFVNFLALLGWSPGGDREILSISELISLFSLDNLSKTNSVFDFKKLEWMNGEYINRLSNEDLFDRLLSFLPTTDSQQLVANKEYGLKVIGILKDRMRKLTDFFALGDYFFKPPVEYDKDGIENYFNHKETQARLSLLKDRLSKLEEFNIESVERTVRELALEFGIKAALLIHPIRLALTGKTVGPSLFHITDILGKDAVIQRLDRAITFLRSATSKCR
ncbi:MAG: glutamate--tRNA ligase [bacterium]|nr:glutamate--tRNA ligase [bacterium]